VECGWHGETCRSHFAPHIQHVSINERKVRLNACFVEEKPMPAGDHFYTLSAAERDNALAQFGYIDEGIACNAFAWQAPGTVPLLRLYHPGTNDHFYTTSPQEAANAVTMYGYQAEGTACFVFDLAGAQRLPLLRLLNATTGDHFYTTSQPEATNAVNTFGYTSEGTACFVPDATVAGTTPLLRLLKVADIIASIRLHFKILTNPNTPIADMLRSMRRVYAAAGIRVDVVPFELYVSEGLACFVFTTQLAGTVPLHRLRGGTDHFYTTSTVERDNAIANFGYVSEGIACFVYDVQVAGTVALHRLASYTNGDHFYTTSTVERDNAIAQFGYVSEGIACFVFDGAAANTSAFLRLRSNASGDHFYTTSEAEAALATLVQFLDFPLLTDLDTGACNRGTNTTELGQLHANRDNVQADDIVVYFVRSTNGSAGVLNGCASFPAGSPGCVITRIASQWSLAHEVGHVLGLDHIATEASSTTGSCIVPGFVPTRLMTGCGTGLIAGTPTLSATEITTMRDSSLTH
jgi:hypothetical protein